MSPATHLAFETIAASVAEIMPDVVVADVSIDGMLADYGCNSLDRADIVWKTVEDLNLDIPVPEFARVNNIRGFTELLSRHLNAL